MLERLVVETLYPYDLVARFLAANDADLRGGDPRALGDQAAERFVGLAVNRRRGNARLHDAVAHTDQLVAIATRAQANVNLGGLAHTARFTVHGVSDADGIEALTEAIGRYNDAWNAQDLDAIVAMHAPDMVFANHTAGESAEGEEVRAHIARIFEAWPDMKFETRRLYVREGVVTQEWTATATHTQTMRRGDLEAPPSGRVVSWDGIDVIPFENGLIKRKDVYSDSVSILRQVGLLD
jgi:steroid delta-isomerase-like uncharacterized protein